MILCCSANALPCVRFLREAKLDAINFLTLSPFMSARRVRYDRWRKGEREPPKQQLTEDLGESLAAWMMARISHDEAAAIINQITALRTNPRPPSQGFK